MVSQVTIVTCYYRLAASKHGHDRYAQWIPTMLGSLRTPVVIFTGDGDTRDYLRGVRGSRPATCMVKSLDEFHVSNRGWDWEYHYRIDPEKAYHNIELYKIWNEKASFVKQAIDANPFGSEAFVWCDIGSFRLDPGEVDPREHPDWPNPQKIPPDRVLLCQTGPLSRRMARLREDGLTKYDLTRRWTNVGGTFAGHRDALLRWYDAYYAMMEKYAAAGRFMGKDQNVMANVMFAMPDLVQLIPLRKREGDPWFALHRYLV